MWRCFLFASILAACGSSDNPEIFDTAKKDSVLTYGFPHHFPTPVIPEDNAPTPERLALGKELFFSPVFSGDGKTSCASCHHPSLAFADTAVITAGVNGRKGFRNSPSLVNIAWHPAFMLDGGVPTLELQVLAPFAGHSELDFSLLHAVEILSNDADWSKKSVQAYGRKPDTYVITRALACYQRSLFDGDSKYDKFILDSINHPLSDKEKKGMRLFFSSKTGCANCHSGMLFSDFTYQNIGLYEHYADSGRSKITLRTRDSGKFKTPSLRNVAITPPYMHDGSIKTLAGVVEFYETGGKNHPNKSTLIKKFNLTNEEREALVEFLKTLTGNTFLSPK